MRGEGPPSRLRTLVVSLLVLAFVAGASAGVAADRLAIRTRAVQLRITTMAPVLDRLKLTEAQRAHADAIVERSAPRSHAIMLEAAERLRAVADSVDAELRAILTAEQRRRLDSLRSGTRLLLKRKAVTPEGVTVDTVLDVPPTTRPPR